ncbi:hypothetical protein B6D03_10110 [Gilliamella apicola]|nr:hypothetical protein B6D03_10110 [Gilliamella apicola]
MLMNPIIVAINSKAPIIINPNKASKPMSSERISLRASKTCSLLTLPFNKLYLTIIFILT